RRQHPRRQPSRWRRRVHRAPAVRRRQHARRRAACGVAVALVGGSRLSAKNERRRRLFRQPTTGNRQPDFLKLRSPRIALIVFGFWLFRSPMTSADLSPSPSASPSLARRELGWFLLVAFVIIGAGIGLRDPWPADEPRFALSAKQMVESGNWLIPH